MFVKVLFHLGHLEQLSSDKWRSEAQLPELKFSTMKASICSFLSKLSARCALCQLPVQRFIGPQAAWWRGATIAVLSLRRSIINKWSEAGKTWSAGGLFFTHLIYH